MKFFVCLWGMIVHCSWNDWIIQIFLWTWDFSFCSHSDSKTLYDVSTFCMCIGRLLQLSRLELFAYKEHFLNFQTKDSHQLTKYSGVFKLELILYFQIMIQTFRMRKKNFTKISTNKQRFGILLVCTLLPEVRMRSEIFVHRPHSCPKDSISYWTRQVDYRIA